MGNTADKERDPSESSGLNDMMEIASSLGLDDDDVASAGVTRADDDEGEDELDNLGAGYGGAAAAALISDASLDPEPAPAANRPSESQVSRAAPPPPPAAAKTRHPSGSTRAVEDAPAAAAAVSTSSAPKPSRAVSESQPVVAAPKASASSSLLAPPPPIVVPKAQTQQEEKKKGGFLLIAVGLIALLGIGWFIYNSQNQVKEHPIAANDVRAAASAPEEPPPPPPKPEPKKVEPPPPPPPVEEEPVVEPPPPVEEAKAEVTVTRKKKGSGKAGSDGDKPDPSAAADKGPTQAEIDEKFRTECLLNPTKPGCDELRKKQRDAGDLDAKLVDKLTASQIREGFGKVKGKAKACGGETGTVVKVKVSINGSGEVTSVNALDEHAGTPLGNCVEDALKDAKFPRFSSESQGAVYPVSF